MSQMSFDGVNMLGWLDTFVSGRRPLNLELVSHICFFSDCVEELREGKEYRVDQRNFPIETRSNGSSSRDWA